MMTPVERPIVHIGYHKTATTWFQKRIWPASTSHDFVPRALTQRALLAPPGLHFDPELAASTLGLDRRERPVILSEENLSGYLHNGGLHGLIGPEMARRIHQALPDAQIVIFVRNQRDIIRAAYAQYVAGGGTYSLERYLDTNGEEDGALAKPYKAPAFEWEHFEFDRLVAFYDRLFGRDNVFVYPYEWLADSHELLRRLSSDLGAELHLPMGSQEPKNASLGAFGLTLLRFVNLFSRQSVVNKTCLIDLPGGPGLRHTMRSLLAKLPAREHRLPPKLVQRIDRFYAASNHRLLAGRDLPLEELGYPIAAALAEKAAHGGMRTVA